MKLPDITLMMFVPADLIWASMEDCAPLPRATIAMTAATR